MDFENLNCPQYVSFNSDSFQESFKNTSLSDSRQSFNQFPVHICHLESPDAKTAAPKLLKSNTNNVLKDANFNSRNNTQPNSKLQNRSGKINSIAVKQVSNFSKGKKNNMKENNYSSLAEKINSYQKKTPERYRTLKKENLYLSKLRPRLKVETKPQALNKIAQSNKTKKIENQRTTKCNVPLKLSNFKSNTLIPHSTKAIQKLESKTSIPVRAIQKMEDNLLKGLGGNEAYTFRARPVPKNIFQGPTGLGKKPVFVNTVAKSPLFASKKNSQKRKLIEQEQEMEKKTPKIINCKLKPMPKSKKITCTKVQPFSFNKNNPMKISQDGVAQKSKPIVFQEKFIPTFQSSILPNNEKKIGHVQTSDANLNNTTSIKKGAVSEINAFKVKVLQKKLFVPEKAPKRKMEFQEFGLHTKERALKRLEMKRQKEIEDIQKDKLIHQENEKQMINFCQNFPGNFNSTKIKRNPKRVTVAISPKFETEKRLRSKNKESKYFGLL